MKVIVLVGGQGTRLRPLTYTTPKPMLPIGNVPMIERVTSAVRDLDGVDGVVLSLGYKPDAFRAAFPDDRIAGLPATYAVEPEKMDTAGAIRFAAEAAGVDETFIVLNGDVLTDYDIGDLVELHRSSGAEATISLTAVDDPSRFGVVPTDDQHRVTGFIEKPPPGEAPTNLISAGTYVMEPSVIERIPAGRAVSVERETFPQLVDEGRLFAKELPGYWLDTGTPQQFVQAHVELFGRVDPVAPGAREVRPGVWVEGDASVPDALTGPVLVAGGVEIAGDASISDSVLGAGATVGAGASVKGSVLLPGAVVADGATVSDSIIGHRGRVGAGSSATDHTIVGDDAAIDDGAKVSEGRVQ